MSLHEDDEKEEGGIEYKREFSLLEVIDSA